MNNHHHRGNSHFRNPRHQQQNRASYNSDRPLPHPNHLDSYPDRHDCHPPFDPPLPDLSYTNPPLHRRRDKPRQRRDSAGYGGTPSSDVPERGTPVGPIGRDLTPHHRGNYNIPAPSPPYRSDNCRNEPRDSYPSTSKPSLQKNSFRGGCPFIAASQIAERKPANGNPNSQPHRALPDHEKAREASSLRNRGTAPTSGPVKSMYNSRSPVKPVNSRSASDHHHTGIISSYGIEDKPSLPEKRIGRSLSCEKRPRPQNMLSSRSSVVRGVSASLGHSAIAPPAATATTDVQPLTQNRMERQNGTNSPSNEGSVETPEKTEQKNAEDSYKVNRHQTPKRASVESIFRCRGKRVPKIPDDNISESPTPVKREEDAPISAQSKQEVKEVVTSSDVGKMRVTRPVLRSVLPPVRNCTVADTPQKRAAAAALHRAGQADGSEVKVGKKYQSSLSDSSHEDTASPHSEPQKAIDNAEKGDKTAGQILATSVSGPGSADQSRGPSNVKTERKPEVGTVENLRMSHLKQATQSSVEGDEQELKSMKRRVTDLDESNRSTAKRPRPVASSEAVNVEDHVTLRRSQRFQPPKTNKNWEITKYEPERVQNLFRTQLRAQPMLLRISFLGISDGDLRSTLDIFKNGMKLPEPDYRSLEINNNRIRCITNEICTSISALRVSSLNLSCNMLTTLGDKLGQCHKLKFLNLSRNRLSCLPQELCDLTNLEVLNLSGNNIARLPLGLYRLKKLEILSLARNKLEVLPEDVAGEGAALTGLDISHNHGFRFFPRCTEHWTKLLVLHMPDTEIYRSLSRREHRLRPSALLKELAGRNQSMLAARRAALRSHGETIRR